MYWNSTDLSAETNLTGYDYNGCSYKYVFIQQFKNISLGKHSTIAVRLDNLPLRWLEQISPVSFHSHFPVTKIVWAGQLSTDITR